MEVQFSTLTEKVVQPGSTLFVNACCPGLDLVALASGSSLSLSRTTSKADSVWEYTTPKPLAKGKPPPEPQGDITHLAWDPAGKYIAVAHSSPASLVLVSVQSGLAALPPLSLPTPRSPLASLSWHSLPHTPDPLLSSFASTLIAKLPLLPVIASEGLKPALGPTAPGSGVFGSAKNAMLAREREKEAGRALDMRVAARDWPTFVGVEDGDRELSLLVAGHEDGTLNVFLNGSVFLGHVQLAQGSGAVIGTVVLPSPAASLAVLVETNQALSLRTVDLQLPPALVILARQSTLLRNCIAHAFDALQDARNSWDESRRIGKGWLARLADNSKAQATPQTPITQLLLLLMTGRASSALHDFLASKMNERVLAKWEATTATALEKLRHAAFASVGPAIERAVVLLDEILAWSSWPEKFSTFSLSAPLISASLQTLSLLLSLSTSLEVLALEEERSFSSFWHWLRFELEKVALQDGSDLRPLARFQPIPVAHYIRHCLPVDAGGIAPLLNFGLGDAMRSVGRSAVVAEEVGLGEIDTERKLVRERLLEEGGPHHVAWISNHRFQMTRRDPSSGALELTWAPLPAGVEVVDFDFYDDTELQFVLKTSDADDAVSYTLSTVPLALFTFSSTPTAVRPSLRLLQSFH
ncbi:hypothetical protein RQP46_005936 [Phenoliferia psychrophenolica]